MTFEILIQIVLLGIALSMDAFSVALVDGLTMKDITKKRYFFVAGSFGLMQALMPLAGFWIVEAVEKIGVGHHIPASQRHHGQITSREDIGKLTTHVDHVLQLQEPYEYH